MNILPPPLRYLVPLYTLSGKVCFEAMLPEAYTARVRVSQAAFARKFKWRSNKKTSFVNVFLPNSSCSMTYFILMNILYKYL